MGVGAGSWAGCCCSTTTGAVFLCSFKYANTAPLEINKRTTKPKTTLISILLRVNDFGRGEEAVFAGIECGGGLFGDGVGDASVEALDHAIGLRVEGFGELVADAVFGAQAIEGMASGAGVAFDIAGGAEAVGEL